MMPDLTQYLLKTGPIDLGDLLTRLPEAATHLVELRSSGQIELEGDATPMRQVDVLLQQLGSERSQPPDRTAAMLVGALSTAPEMKRVRVRLSQVGFKRAFRA